jgi:hypothetical protein
MSGIDAVFWWTGAATLLAIAGAIGFAVGGVCRMLFVGFPIAVDHIKWQVAGARKNGRKPMWWRLPLCFPGIWFDMSFNYENIISYDSKCGQWRGYKDWEVWRTGVAGPVLTFKGGKNG